MHTTQRTIVLLVFTGLLFFGASPAASEPDAPTGRAPALGPVPGAPVGGDAPAAPDPVVNEPASSPPTGPLPPLPDMPVPASGVRPVQRVPIELARLRAEAGPNRAGPKLPSAIGQAPAQARRTLSTWRVRLESSFAADTLAGRIIDQRPRPGELLAPGEEVTIVLGVTDYPTPQHRSVPGVGGQRADTALARVEAAGWKPVLRTLPSKASQTGLVIGQTPLAGSLAPKGSTIVLRIGRGGLIDPVVRPVAPPARAPVPAPAPLARPKRAPAPLPLPDDAFPMPPVPSPVPAGTPPGATETDAEARTPAPRPLPPTPPPAAPRAPAPLPIPAPLPVPAPEPAPAPIPVPAPEPAPPPRTQLGRPTLISPSEAQSFPRAYGSTFQWTAVRGAETYDWELERQERNGTWSPKATQEVEGTRYRPASMDKGRFRWRVRARKGDVQSEWSPYFRLYMY